MINKSPNYLHQLIDLFKEMGIDDQVVLIGSWCELFYESILDAFEANIRTTDIDIYYHNFNQPQKEVPFITAMEEIGFYITESVFPTKSKFINEELEIEFLTRLSRNHSTTEKIKPLNIYAECLTECEMFGNERNVIKCKSVKYDLEIRVPTPVAYCMHKILINDSRKMEKQIKDKQAILRLIPYIMDSDVYCQDWKRIFNSFSKKEKKRFLNNLEKIELSKSVFELCK